MASKVTIDLDGKIALITGASRGIGRASALLLAEAGARVMINYFQSETEARAVQTRIGGDLAEIVQADLGDAAAVEAMVGATVRRFGGIDILVNNAGTFDMNRFDRDDYGRWTAGWQRTFAVNIFGAANAAFLAMREMRRGGGGTIINVASRAAFRGETEFADYGASKAAMVNLTRSIARACAKDHITSTCVAPGFIETDMAASELQLHRAAIEAQIPLGYVGTAEQVARTILFLASPFAEYLNGTTVDVNGGSWFH
jgi:NAD(P)-dependent dehydrogenase (short-subunit alcohol dehydrogenase family)